VQISLEPLCFHPKPLYLFSLSDRFELLRRSGSRQQVDMRPRQILPAVLVAIALSAAVAGAATAQTARSSRPAVTSRAADRASSDGKELAPAPLNTTSWSTFLTDEGTNGYAWNPGINGGSGFTAGGYPVAYFSPSNLVRHPNGSFTITATPGSLEPGFTWTSAILVSYGSYSVDGGYISFDAEMPHLTDGAWPALFLLSGPGNTQNDEIDLFEGGVRLGRSSADHNFSGTVHINDTRSKGDIVRVRPSLAGVYHDYGLKWVPGKSLTWYLDGMQLFEITSKQFTIPSGPMELIATLEIVSRGASGWHTLPTVLQNFQMRVQSITVTPLSGPAPWATTTPTTSS
jgi:beta-glucanase (GH16 family)